MTTKLEQLKAKLSELYYLNKVAQLVSWDQQTYMPRGGAVARARHASTLAGVLHRMATDPAMGDLLSAAEDEVGESGTDDAAMLRMARRDYDRLTKVPVELMAEHSLVTAQAHEAWAEARRQSDYSMFAPWLEKVLALTLRITDHLGFEDSRYDAMLDQFEPGMKTAQVRAIFDNLKAELVPLVKAVLAKAKPDDGVLLYGDFDPDRQRQFGEEIIRDFGFDFDRGRQDESVHPFTTSFSPGDVRLTTRFDPNWLAPALFGTLHEAGHGLYEQGLPVELEGNILCRYASLGVHESQSRLWENVVGRSKGFWQHYYPRLQAIFPEQFGGVDLADFYRAVNAVSASFIRVESDELTYNLHIMLRFDLEVALLAGDLSVEDAPAAWNEKMEALLGVTPPDDARGILQDVHWSGGMIGYFPTYSLGNLLSVQLYNKAVEASPDIPDQIAAGEFEALLGWMRENVHRQGRKYLPNELVEQVTGEPMQSRSYMAYLREKYGELYSV